MLRARCSTVACCCWSAADSGAVRARARCRADMRCPIVLAAEQTCAAPLRSLYPRSCQACLQASAAGTACLGPATAALRPAPNVQPLAASEQAADRFHAPPAGLRSPPPQARQLAWLRHMPGAPQHLTFLAPALRTMFTIWLMVVPRTMESSTSSTLLSAGQAGGVEACARVKAHGHSARNRVVLHQQHTLVLEGWQAGWRQASQVLCSWLVTQALHFMHMQHTPPLQ